MLHLPKSAQGFTEGGVLAFELLLKRAELQEQVCFNKQDEAQMIYEIYSQEQIKSCTP